MAAGWSMLTILEGPDGAGKSRLAEYLAKKLDASIWHHGARPEVGDTFSLYWESVNAAHRSNVIMDRSWLSDLVYASKPGRIDTAQIRMLERAALSVEVVVVFCMPPLEVCQKVWRRRIRNEFLKTEEDFQRIYWRYNRLQKTYDRLPSLVYDRTRETQTSLLEGVAQYRSGPNPGPGWGSWEPHRSVLIVGDHPENDFYDEVPYVDDERMSTSSWLARGFEQAGVPEHRLYWVYAVTSEGRTDVELLKELVPPAVCALGSMAQGWAVPLTNRGVRPYDNPGYLWHSGQTEDYKLFVDVRRLLAAHD